MRKNQKYCYLFSFRELLKIVLLLFLPAFLCDCQSSNSNKEIQQSTFQQLSSTNKRTEIEWMAPWQGEGSKELLIREAGRNFEFLNQDIQLELKFTNEIYPDELWYTAVLGGILEMIKEDEWPYDIMICERGHYAEIANNLNDPNWQKKYLVDFSEEDWFVEAHREGIISSQFIGFNYGGIVPGPIIEGTIYVLYVSTEVEEKLGIKVNRLDMTLDNFIDYAEKVYNYNQTNDEKISFFSTQDVSAISRLFKHLVLTDYGKEKFSSKAESFASLSKVYAAFEELSKFNPTENYVDYGDLNSAAIQYVLNEKDYLFNLQPTWIYNVWQGSYPEGINKIKPCELPSIEGKTPPHYEGNFQTLFAVPKRGENVEQAKKLIKYLTTRDIGEKWISNTKCPTGLKTRISFTDFGQEEFDVFFRHMQSKYGIKFEETDLYPMLWGKSPNYTFSEQTFNEDFMHQDVLGGKISANKAMERVHRKYD